MLFNINNVILIEYFKHNKLSTKRDWGEKKKSMIWNCYSNTKCILWEIGQTLLFEKLFGINM